MFIKYFTLIYILLVLWVLLSIFWINRRKKINDKIVHAIDSEIKPFTGEDAPDDRGLTRQNIFTNNWNSWIYFCKCGTQLTEGPSGGVSVNAVCKQCKINYGCLPGYYGD